MKDIKAFLFDLDGVLLDTPPYHFLAWHWVLKQLGADISKRHYFLLEGKKAEEILEGLIEVYGLKSPSEGLGFWVQKKREKYQSIADIQWYPGALNVLKSLRKSGFRVALVTGAARKTIKCTLDDRFLSLFDIIQTADDTKQCKPNPAPYAEAAEKLGVDPIHCMAVENAPLGIRSAKAAGMTCVAVETTLPAEDLHEADYCIPDIDHLFDIPILHAFVG